MQKGGKTGSLLCIFLALLLVISIFIMACSNQSSPTSKTAATTATTAKTAAPATTSQAQSSSSEAPIILTFAGESTENSLKAQNIWIPWFKSIEEATGGKVKIQPYYAASLCTYTEQYNAVVSDLVDITHFAPCESPGVFPISDIGLLSSWDKFSWRYSHAVWELYNTFPEIQAEYTNVKVLAINSAAPTVISATKDPIRTLADCNGKKWNVGGNIFELRAKALGAVPVAIPPPMIYSSMEKGVIDGGIIVPEWLTSFSMSEQVKAVTTVPFNTTPLVFAINWDKWNSLSPDIQKAIESVSGDALVDRCDTAEMTAYVDGLAGAKEKGIEVIDLSAEELAKWVAVDKPVVTKVISDLAAKGVQAQTIYDKWLELEAKYTAAEYKISK